MIQRKHLISTIIFCSTLSLYAIDINNTTEIIEEATKATESLQEDFSKIVEKEEHTQQKIISIAKDNNITIQEVTIIENSDENISIKEDNQTIQEPIVVENSDENITIKKENNETIQESNITKNKIVEATKIIVDTNKTSIPEANLTEEENQTVEQESAIEDEEGSYKEGMIIFKTKLKKVCKMTGDDFAKNYTQEDWDDIYDNNEFEKVVYELCPAIKGKYDKKWTKDLYQFSLKYASDSDEIPEC